MKCFFHPHRDALTRCKQCHRPICSHCRMNTPDGIFCSDDCWRNFHEYAERIAALGPSVPRSEGWKAGLRKIGTVLFLIIAVYAYIFDLWGFRTKLHGVVGHVGTSCVQFGHKVRDSFRTTRDARREGQPILTPDY